MRALYLRRRLPSVGSTRLPFVWTDAGTFVDDLLTRLTTSLLCVRHPAPPARLQRELTPFDAVRVDPRGRLDVVRRGCSVPVSRRRS